MASDEVVNPMSSPSKRRWQLFQFLGPVLGVVLVIGAIALVTLHNYNTTRQGAITLSNSLLKSQQRYITQEVAHYLSPATSSSIVAHDMLNRDPDVQNASTFMLLGRSILRNVPQVASFYLADEDGHFWMMARRDGQYEETTFRTENGHPVYRHNVVDAEGRFLSTDALEANDFDVRQVPWYTGAVRFAEKGKQLFWTDPYPYLSTHQFIITASLAFKTLDGRRMVFATNISLNQLTKFVNSLKVGKSGQAVIVDLSGHVIAGHNMAGLGTPGFDASNVQLDPVTQPVFVRALNVFRIRGDGAGIVHARNQDYVTIASAMPLAKRSWVLLLNAPENDFASFAHVVQNQTISFSLVIVGLASLLAVALIYQGRRVLLYQRSVQTGLEEARHENAALLRIANAPGLLDPQCEIPVLTEVLAERSGARRASVWRMLSDGDRLLCEDMFDVTRDVHGAGVELTRMAYPELFEVLGEMHPIDVLDATQDTRFQGFQRVMMRTVDARRLSLWPVTEQHRPVGAIMVEEPLYQHDVERVFAFAAAVMAVRFDKLTQQAPDSAASAETLEGAVQQSGSSNHMVMRESEGFLLDPSKGEKFPAAGLYAQVPLMVLEFSEAYTGQREGAKRVLTLVQHLSEKLQQIARDAGLFSMQVAGSRVIFMGSCSQKPDTGALLRLANAAITMRETCLMAITSMPTRLMFRIGLDIGPIMAACLGDSPSIFNIWGEALSVAELLAHNAPDGGQIQVSEQAYQELRSYFLFRPRGNFYLPHTGITRIYILAGRR